MKDKTVAAIFALFLGWFGIHRFYLRQPGLGVFYILFFFVGGISVILGIIDFIVLLAMDPSEFDRRYNSEAGPEEYDRYKSTNERRDFDRARAREQRQTRRTRPRRGQNRPQKDTVHVPESAIEDLKKGLEINSKDIALHFNLACAYSLSEKASDAYFHIDKAVQFGFRDFEKISNHEDLAFVRIQKEFDEFKQNGFRLEPQPMLEAPKTEALQDDLLLQQLNRLKELRDKGLITDNEFLTEKEKLMR